MKELQLQLETKTQTKIEILRILDQGRNLGNTQLKEIYFKYEIIIQPLHFSIILLVFVNRYNNPEK